MTIQDWNPATEPLVLKERRKETYDTVSFIFTTASAKTFHFKPGQFVTLKVEVNRKTYARSYSISTLPETSVIGLTIKRVKDGVVSNWLIDHLQPGEKLQTVGIAGGFNIIDCPPKKQVLFVSAGCGITPVMAMARYLLAYGGNAVERMDFLHCARDAANVIYALEMTQLALAHARFHPHILLEHQLADENKPVPDTRYGLISAQYLRTVCPHLNEASVYLCGPRGFMAATEEILHSCGFDMAQLFHEDFVPHDDHTQGVCFDAVSTRHSASLHQFNVSVPSFKFNQLVSAGATLLNVLEAGHVPVIGACRSGVCGSCKCRVTKGKVKSTSTATLTAEQITQGFVLACSSTVEEDIEVALR